VPGPHTPQRYVYVSTSQCCDRTLVTTHTMELQQKRMIEL